MIVKLEQHIIEVTKNVTGKVINYRYEYLISIKRHWWKIWKKPRYLRLIPGWQNVIFTDSIVKVQLVSRTYATSFTENCNDTYNCKATAEYIVELLRECPDRFIIY